MKNAIFFMLFNLFIIFSLFYNIFNEKKSINKSSDNSLRQNVLNFNYTIILKDDFINIEGKKLSKNEDLTFIEDLTGYYSQKNNKIIFSAKEGLYKDSSSFILKDSAKIISDNNQITSNEFIYDLREGKIFSSSKTSIELNNIKIEGFNLVYDLNKKKLKAENIKGKI